MLSGSWIVAVVVIVHLATTCVCYSLCVQLQSLKLANDHLQRTVDHLMTEKVRMEAKMEKDSL